MEIDILFAILKFLVVTFYLRFAYVKVAQLSHSSLNKQTSLPYANK